jgi:hypothetical protein
MTLRRAAVVLVCLAASLPAVAPVALAAQTDREAGYWWIAQPDGGGVPPPSSVPAGGLSVASAATGATAVSAVHFVLPVGVAPVRLTLKVAAVQQVDAVAVDAFPATRQWKPGDAQPWSERPSYDAKAAPLHGTLLADASSLVFNLPSGASPGVLDLVLVPAAATPVSPTFDLSLQPLTASSLTTSAAPPAVAGVPVPAPPAAVDTGVVTSPPLGLSPPLPALGAVGILQDTPRVATSTPAALAAAPAAAATPLARQVVTGRSRRDIALLVFLLADVMFYLGWLSRGARTTTSGPRLSIYDLPPPPPPATD